MPDSLVSTDWELIDPTPDPLALFSQYNKRFFWGKLDSVVVTWSPRMTSCAGICCYEGRGGLCSIRLSTPLLKLRPRKDLVETLLHEMIHAYLFVTQNNRDRDGHGPEFQKHMHRINSEAKTNITIYHTFNDEVRHYKTHVWKCTGPCQHRKPYYGIVKRASNRAPGPNDFWWKEHQSSCGGTYKKISEPEEFTQKQQKKKDKQEAKEKKEDVRRKSLITNYVTNGKGKALQNTKYSPGVKSKKPAFTGVNTLGSTSKATSSSTGSAPIRRIPGFGDIPVRVGTQTAQPRQTTLNFSPSFKQSHTALDDTGYNSESSLKANKPSTSASTSSHISQIVLANCKPGSSGSEMPAGRLSTVVGGTSKRPTGANNSKLPNTQPMSSYTNGSSTITLSDSDDDIPLLTRASPLLDTKSPSKRSRTSQPPTTGTQLIELSDSDEDQLDELLTELKSKNKRHKPSTCVSTCVKSRSNDEDCTESKEQWVDTEQPCPICAVVMSVEVLPHHVDECFGASDEPAVIRHVGGDGPADVSGRVECPVCSQTVPLHFINEHIDSMCATHV